MNTLKLTPADTDTKVQEIALLANEIWHEHFPDIIGNSQVDYMVEKFQSYNAMKEQIENGYEYFQIRRDDVLVGYTGIHEESGRLFLSKLYIKKEMRGFHISSDAFQFLLELCRQRDLSAIWLTCNKHNAHTLDIYRHWGFSTIKEEKTDIGNGFFMDDYILEYMI